LPKRTVARVLLGVAAILTGTLVAGAQTAEQAWLKYPMRGPLVLPIRMRLLGTRPLEISAGRELNRGTTAIGSVHSNDADSVAHGEMVVGTWSEVHAAFPEVNLPADPGPEGYWLHWGERNGHAFIVVAGSDERGVLYGTYDLLRRVAMREDLSHLDVTERPAMPIRWVDEWDNADGSIERGYAGRSIFFDAGHVREDLKPVDEYGKLLASVGVNGCNVNNVNNAAPFLQADFLHGLARIADALRPWGVHVAMSVDIASPQKIGGLATYDPLDPAVQEWWAAKVNEIYVLIPDFAGFTVKADSEGQPGPASYGRTPADAANLLANALAPHHGVVLYRAFVYNHHLDWHDPKADRARAAYDIFHLLDGEFADNVIVQTKEGPIDFQAREPVSPLFGGLEKTNQAMEVQITQEYTGQQRHLVYLAPMWKEMLDLDLRAENRSTPVRDVIAGKSFQRPLGGMVGVAGVGQNAWLNSPLALANLYAFGRLAWNPARSPERIADEWTRQTLGTDRDVVRTVDMMLMQSWPAYEHYTGPLGMQTLTDITGSHYGPNIESSENNGWGQWHHADHDGVGMDRSVATGTGYAGQYWPEVAKTYEAAATTPDDLLLFFHHVPYTWKLHNGSTVIQYIYDSHYEGADEAAMLGEEWSRLNGKVDPKLFADMQARLAYQAGHAMVWRDAIVQYFLKLSGIADEQGRAGHNPNRLEAEDARLMGYTIFDVAPWEDASGGKAVTCAAATPAIGTSQAGCAAEWTYNGAAGMFNVAVQYFDLAGGSAHFSLSVNGQAKDSWTADAEFPSRRPNGDNSTRRVVRGVGLKAGDVIRVEGTPDKADPAAVDYVEIVPAGAAH